ncbi:YecH family metal-binding protein [Hoylesella buccalis]|uniref:YecH family metal-binding protein n=1 Tax=Hoylesella buccalis TaxID=28127 RepID=UPI001D062421|nr:YecH family metal-binding protein [Hoylesella buccalis]MCB6901991.1 YecH family protein [Hoylesella buccalis]
MIHGHEVLQMMQGNSYSSKEELVKAIISRFGEVERFYTCSAEGMTAAQLVDFLEQRGKFKSAHSDGFTVDTSKVCNH